MSEVGGLLASVKPKVFHTLEHVRNDVDLFRWIHDRFHYAIHWIPN